jgi:hypothetical protein
MKNLILIGCFLLCSSTVWGQNFEVYVSDAGNLALPPWQILKYDMNGENPEVFIDENLGWPQDIVFLEEAGTVLISNLNTNRINRHNAETGEFIDIFASNLSGPTRMKIGPDNLLYVLQWSGDGLVRRYQLDGTPAGNFTSLGVSQSIGLDWDTAGNLYVSSFGGARVIKFGPSGNSLGTFITKDLLGPTNIWFNDIGELLVSDWSGASIKRFSAGGAFLGVWITGVSKTEGVAYMPNGNLLIGVGGSRSVRMYDSDGVFIENFVPSRFGGLIMPNAVVVREVEGGPNFKINSGLNDAWFNPATPGQGILIAVFPDIMQMFVAWFTYDTQRPPGDVTAILGGPGQRWLTAQGPIVGDTANLTLFLTEGGVFDAATPPATTDPAGDGTMTVEFASCSEGLVTYEIDSLDLSGEIPIERIALDNIALCEMLAQ